jgi:hypothetical protein
MRELASGVAVFVLLCASAGLGILVRPRLPEHHRTRESLELMQITIGLLVTFAAVVLGLLTASVKQEYDSAAHDRQHYALQLTLLDECLGNYGSDAVKARADLKSYTAAVIASTWPDEPPPTGVQYPDVAGMPRVGETPILDALMDRIGLEVSGLTVIDALHTKLAGLCLDRYKDVSHARLSVIEAARSDLFEPFYQMVVVWLMIIFALFGLVAPRNTLSFITIGLSAISLSSVLFVILDLSAPYGGFFSIPSATMRAALSSMLSAGH